MNIKQKIVAFLSLVLAVLSIALAFPRNTVAATDQMANHYVIGLTISENDGSAGNSGSSGNSGNSGNSGSSGVSGSSGTSSEEEEDYKVQNVEPTDNIDEIYKRYKDNSFSLMNVEYESLNIINSFLQNANSWLKNFVFSGVVMTGKFNSELTHILFSLDIANSVKKPFQDMSLSIGKKMSTGAMTIGVVIIALAIVARFALTGKMSQALKVAALALLTATSFAIFNSTSGNDMFFNGVLEIDHQVENMVAGVNPQFQQNEKTGKSVAEKIRAEVFHANVYQPYLYMNYGTTDTEKIREKNIEYGGNTYDRIGALLDNDGASKKQVAFVQKITDYEADKLNNKNISYLNSAANTAYSFFYILTNLIQTVIFFVLGMLRLALQMLLVMVPVLLPVVLFLAMCFVESGLLLGYFKGLFSISLIKSGVSLVTIIYVSYVSLGYKTVQSSSNIFQTIITLIAWLLAPLMIYVFRYLLAGIFSSRSRMLSGGMINSAIHPFRAANNASQARAREKEKREDERAAKRKAFEARKKKQEQEGIPSDNTKLNDPKNLKNNKRDQKFRKNRVAPEENDPSKNTDSPSDKDDMKHLKGEDHRESADAARRERLERAKQGGDANDSTSEEEKNQLNHLRNKDGQTDSDNARSERLERAKQNGNANDSESEDGKNQLNHLKNKDGKTDSNNAKSERSARTDDSKTNAANQVQSTGEEEKNTLKKGNRPPNGGEVEKAGRQRRVLAHSSNGTSDSQLNGSSKSPGDHSSQVRNDRVDSQKSNEPIISGSTHANDQLNKAPKISDQAVNNRGDRSNRQVTYNQRTYDPETGEILTQGRNKRQRKPKETLNLNQKLQSKNKSIRQSNRSTTIKSERFSTKTQQLNKVNQPTSKRKRK